MESLRKTLAADKERTKYGAHAPAHSASTLQGRAPPSAPLASSALRNAHAHHPDRAGAAVAGERAQRSGDSLKALAQSFLRKEKTRTPRVLD